MDLEQRKLTKAEWDSIEKQIPAAEKEILQMIITGYNNVNIKHNKNKTVLSHLKIEETDQVHEYIFQKYYLDKIVHIATAYDIGDVDKPYKTLSKKLKTMKKTMIIRMQRYTSELIEKEDLLEIKFLTPTIKLKQLKNQIFKRREFLILKLVKLLN